tara:strand:+ start:571 stop:768 length:198 start_codon:yes stop_codon:yes gene_type:complete
MTPAEKFLTIWMENFTKHNEGFLDSILDDDVSFHSPVIFKPLPGKDLLSLRKLRETSYCEELASS